MSDAIERKLREDVEKHGWHVLNVLSKGGTSPGWSYSVGLFHTFGHPEIVVVGLPPDTGHAIINDVGAAIRAGRRLEDGMVDAGFLEGYDSLFRQVPASRYESHFGRAIDFYGGTDFPVLQLVYPDREGRWPWEEGVAAGFREAQPVLALEPGAGAAAT